MLLYLRLAWRNIWRHRRRTLIIVLAMGLGMALMIFYDGLMAGFNEAIYGNAIRVLGAPPGSIRLMDTASLKEWFMPAEAPRPKLAEIPTQAARGA